MPFRLTVILLVAAVLVVPLRSQVNPQKASPPYGAPSGNPEDEARARLEKDMEKRRNLARQEQIKRDSDKLLQLATELKATSTDRTKTSCPWK